MARTSKKKISVFANIIISVSIFFCAVITVVTLYEYHRLCIPMPSDVLGELKTMWCGELLFIMIRQIFGSDVVGKAIAKIRGTEE